jgi:hypothetical protein
MYQRRRHAKVVQKHVAKPSPHVSALDKACDIDHARWHVPDPINAGGILRIALDVELSAWAWTSDIRNANVRVYRRERVVCHLGIRQSRSVEKSRLAGIRLANQAKFKHG